jgi:glycosyltransferase involved in cell wall biosynthesis
LRILVANFFPAFHPPRSGGEQRYYWLYRHLAERHDVTLLSPTYSTHAFEEVCFTPAFRELRVPKDPVFDRLHAELDAQGIGPECSGYVVALAAGLEDAFGMRFIDEVVKADVVIHESPFTLPYDRTFGSDGKPRIYNAYNVEHRLARGMLRGTAGARAADFIADLERALVTHAARVFATSDEDRDLLAADFDAPRERIVLVPNGFEPAKAGRSEVSAREERRVLFIGSAHPPNAEAVRFIVEHLAPALPDVSFRIAGSAGDRLGDALPRNVRCLGVVDDGARDQEFARCTVAINPMFSGSGTNLKALDYLAAGAPMLATPVGARGLGLVDGETAFVAAPDDFAQRLRAVLDDEVLRARVAGAGRTYVHANFTWASIAARADAALEQVAVERTSVRPLLLAVNDFPVAQGQGGGEVRIRELLTELARDFDVVLLALTDEGRRSERSLGPRLREIRIPRTAAHRDADVAAARGERVSISDLVAYEHCLDNAELVARFRAIASGARAVIFEHPYLVPLSRLLPASARVVYSSLNVERRLKADLLRSRRDAAHRIAQTEALEREMLARAGLVVCVSDADRRAFVADGVQAEMIVVENGVRVGNRPVAQVSAERNPRILAIFLGSAHPPNVEAARFLIESLAPALPEVDIVIAGGVCSGVGTIALPENVHLVGPLATAEKDALLARADVALNPLFGGGGSSLKVPDFFAAGLPLVSTAIGVRGYDVEERVHYVEANRDDFVERTRALVADAPRRRALAHHAREYAMRRLDWSIIGRRYCQAMRSFAGVAARPGVLVVTYRFADPPPGGAETFLVNLLKALAARGRVAADVATCDVGTITDRWHFSARYAPGRPAPVPAYCENLFRFPVDPVDEPATLDACRRLFGCWMAETRIHALELGFDASPRPMLLGGWNFVERRDGAAVRWTSAEAHVAVGSHTRAMRIRAYGPAPTRVEARCGDAVVASRSIAGRIDWSFDVPTAPGVVALRVAKPFTAEGDPRELGVLVESIELDQGAGWQTLALDEDFEDAARRDDLSTWVGSLVGITERRDPSVDALFQRVRGPHSGELATWLEANIDDYDVVLAHGTPFSTAVVASEVAKRHGVPVVVLPHVHMEDRYYHWQTYYAMFRNARRVIAAPSSSKSLFFDRLGAASVALPGGGVDTDEFSEARRERARARFAALHRADKPFVLVLGRKTAAKRYRMVVDAVDAVNARGHRVDLVVIGPDEDGEPIVSPHAFAYGARPREVVVGALASALCLVNMSESESFGIVLLEAWLAGRPVVAARKCAAFADLVVHGENGFLAASCEEIAEAVGTYLTEQATATRHGTAGLTLARSHCWPKIAGQIESVLLASRRAPQIESVLLASTRAPRCEREEERR